MISKTYKAMQKKMHEAGGYGKHGDKWKHDVLAMYKKYHCTSALDYGAGQAKLSKKLPGLRIKCYDPCIDMFSAKPNPADLVICTDVLEHIEPEFIEDVLTHIRQLTKKVFFCVIATRPAIKTLPDGRNAHILLRDRDWWIDALGRHSFAFDSDEMNHKGEIIVVCRPC